MYKFVSVSVIALSLFGASIVSAQSYSYYPSYGYATTCVNLTYDLSLGSKGGDVVNLQRFLVAQNYPGGGSWMLTGTFGQATLQAVRMFQQYAGLPVSGVADPMTRSVISQRTCGFGFNQFGQYPYNYNTYNNYNTYPYNNGRPSLTSLSSTFAAPGTRVTIYGSGFEYTNTVYVGGTVLSGIGSNGSSLTFTVPHIQYGAVSVSVMNSRGTSNALTLTVSTNGYDDGDYCTPRIDSISPTSGKIDTTVKIRGKCFSDRGNTIRFGNGIITNVRSSNNGTRISFDVPDTIQAATYGSNLNYYGYGDIRITKGSYNVAVTNTFGLASNYESFRVTSGSSTERPKIVDIDGPSNLDSGEQGTWHITIDNPSGRYTETSVDWDDNTADSSQASYNEDEFELTFKHTYFDDETFEIEVIVEDEDGHEDSETIEVRVRD